MTETDHGLTVEELRCWCGSAVHRRPPDPFDPFVNPVTDSIDLRLACVTNPRHDWRARSRPRNPFWGEDQS